jgi:DNA-binding IclR family transcriptional regulator
MNAAATAKTPQPKEEAPTPALLERQLTVLERVAQTPSGLTFIEIQQSLALPKATAHRLLQTLCAVGLLSATGGAARIYRLGDRLLTQLAFAVSPDRLIPLARPVLGELVKEFGETAFLAMLQAGKVETITMVTPVKDWQGHVHPGRIMPPHAAASAKAIIALRDESSWNAFLRPPLQAFTTKTIVDAAAVRRDYRQIRARGYATCIGEIDLGQTAVAAPIRMGEVGTTLSVCIAGPTHRMREYSIQRIAESLISAASKLERLFVRSIENGTGHAAD